MLPKDGRPNSRANLQSGPLCPAKHGHQGYIQGKTDTTHRWRVILDQLEQKQAVK